MNPLGIEETQGALASSLFRVAANPAMVSALHDLMGGFCHQCRNALNTLKLSLFLATRDAGAASLYHWSELEGQYRSVEQMFDRFQAICRPMVLCPIRASLSLVVDERREEWTELMEQQHRSLTLVPPEGPDVGDFDPMRLPDALDGFVRWRSQVGEPGQAARFRWGAGENRFEFSWSEPSAWGIEGEPSASEQSDPLALAFLARVISAHGGSLTLSLRNGLHLGASWPLVARPT